VNRGPDNPVDVLVLTDTPLPLPVTLIHAVALDPSPNDLMLAAGGVVLTNATDVATAYPNLWRTRAAAKSALQRAVDKSTSYRERLGANPTRDITLIRECTQPLRAVEYQRAGAGRSAAMAFYDPAVVPDPVAWLFEKLGELADWDADPATSEESSLLSEETDGTAPPVADATGRLLSPRQNVSPARPSRHRCGPWAYGSARVSLSTVGDPDPPPQASATLFSG